MTRAIAAALVVLAGCAPRVAAPEPMSCPAPLARLQAGELAPEFVGAGDDGARVALSSLRSRMVVLVFYPDSAHPSHAAEEAKLSAAWRDSSEVGAVVIGVTHESVPDAAASSRAFKLVSDADGAVSNAYGWSAPYDEAQRRTFIIGPDGRIEKVFCQR